MIIQDIYLKDWDWSARIFYAIDECHIDQILGELECVGCNEEDLKRASVCLEKTNAGLTYSNFKYKYSIIVIGLTTSPAKFQNTQMHERNHLAMHITEALDICDEEFEKLLYEIEQQMISKI